MRDLAAALISYAWAQTLFTVQQVLQVTLNAPGNLIVFVYQLEMPVESGC